MSNGQTIQLIIPGLFIFLVLIHLERVAVVESWATRAASNTSAVLAAALVSGASKAGIEVGGTGIL
uniref:Uncharacterized protein n=1 Tax=Romanomermis culicivorax TaxID=13658 RepID=A0A915KAF3_ROMCU